MLVFSGDWNCAVRGRKFPALVFIIFSVLIILNFVYFGLHEKDPSRFENWWNAFRHFNKVKDKKKNDLKWLMIRSILFESDLSKLLTFKFYHLCWNFCSINGLFGYELRTECYKSNSFSFFECLAKQYESGLFAVPGKKVLNNCLHIWRRTCI